MDEWTRHARRRFGKFSSMKEWESTQAQGLGENEKGLTVSPETMMTGSQGHIIIGF